MSIQSLSVKQARKLVVLSNDFHAHGKLKSASASQHSLAHLGYVQIDTISVVNRAHLHVLWSRNQHFNPSHLDRMFADKQMFEYWSHAAAFLPMKDYRFSLLRKQQIAAGDKHWRKREPKMMQSIKSIIAAEGPKKSADFKHKRASKSQWWDWKPAKIALEQLFMEGELMVLKRDGFQKVYDLTERVLPDGVDQSMPSQSEVCRYLIQRYLTAQGLGHLDNFTYLRKGLQKATMQQCLNDMIEDQTLCELEVNGGRYFALIDRLALLNKRLNRRVHLLSPFDNMVIQRQRLRDLFDYDYQIECYVPAAKRRFGYFCLPILYGDQLVGRMDCKAHRKQGVLEVKQRFWEKATKPPAHFEQQFDQALRAFAQFNDCNEVVISNKL